MTGPRLLPFRRAVQVGAALFTAALPFLNARGIIFASGNFFAFDLFGFPLADPLSSAQAALMGGSAAASLLIGAGTALLIALLLGRIFCSWLCPYGLFSELVHSLRVRNAPAGASPAAPRNGAHIRVILTVAAFIAVVLFASAPLLNLFSMPGWFSRTAQEAAFYGAPLWAALVLPAALALEYRMGSRLWCRYICPQSVLLGIAASLPSGLRLRFSRERCTCAKNDRPCLAACSLGLNPRKISAELRLECTNCGDCRDACRARGKALHFWRAGKPAA